MAKLTDDHAARLSKRPKPSSIMQSSHDAIIGVTRQAIVNSWNPAAERLYGYAAREILGRPAEVLYSPGRRAAELEILARVVRGEDVEQFRTHRVRKDGTYTQVLLTASPIVDERGTVIGATTVSRRPTPREDSRDLLGEEQAGPRRVKAPPRGHDTRESHLPQAQRLENLGQLAGGVAHDFNNLLGVILNYASFVAEEMGAATESDWTQRWRAALGDVGQIQLAAERAAALTRQLLAFARREVVRPQVINVNEVIAGVEEMLRRTIGEHVELVTSLGTGLWPVMADPGQLEQVLVNLAVNARDAMPGGGTLTIDTCNITVDTDAIAKGSPARLGPNVRMQVSDTGTGMPANVAEHAFEPFFTTKSEGAGTGLGLATVYGILAQADGHVRIYSEAGAGTSFSITLPVTDQATVAVREPAPYRRTRHAETVLVVEDEEALREVTKRIFTRNGFQVLTAADGPQAFDVARRYDGEIHLLVTDVVMPHMLGKEVADKIRALKPHIEVLYMSGYARPVLASQGRLDPGVALVEKPFSEADLLATAGHVLNGRF
jgi:PAS domain S-box-containing protein